MGKPCSCTQFIKSYYISHGYPYQYYKSCENSYQVLPVKCAASKHAMKSKVHMIITIDLCSINHNRILCSGRLHITFKPASLQGDKVCWLFIHIHVDARQLDSSVFTVESGKGLPAHLDLHITGRDLFSSHTLCLENIYLPTINSQVKTTCLAWPEPVGYCANCYFAVSVIVNTKGLEECYISNQGTLHASWQDSWWCVRVLEAQNRNI